MKLVIIEGIGKVKTVEKYLGKGFKVFATKGHIRDLPSRTLAVNVKHNFEPHYEIITDKKDTVKKMCELAKQADQIYLATDPDREGEAISWHIAHVLEIPEDSPVRIEFNEISERAVKKGLANPRIIDQNLVDAQQARRVLDRLVGYKLSPVLCKKIQGNLSAGRVQSVTLRLVVEREREILNFKPEEYWPFASILTKDRFKFNANLQTKKNKKIKLGNIDEVNAVIKDLEPNPYIIKKIKKSVVKTRANAPFITSTMQQDALNKLGMNLKQTSSAAQALYEGVDIEGEGKTALITYIRTDSTRVSPDAQQKALEFIEKNYGKEYVPAKPNFYATKKTAQDAHEAIRPIDLNYTPERVKSSLSLQHYKLYKLIYERFLASQMVEAKYNSVQVDIENGDYGFKVSGKTLLFPGFTVVYKNFIEEKEDGDNVKLPPMEEGEQIKFVQYKYEQKFTKPPARYNEASLVKTMEEKGIGRPATYSPTVNLLFSRDYTRLEGKSIVPTELGMNVTDMLIKYFPEIMDIKFTANMEDKLDDIEEGGKVWQNVVASFYDGFEEKIAAATGDSFSLKAPDVRTDIKCPNCGSYLLVKTGRYGKFLACPNFPKCRYTQPYETEQDHAKNVDTPQSSIVKKAPIMTDEKCPKCGKPMVIRHGIKGDFLACSGYPKCKTTRSLQENNIQEEELPPCPKCGKPLKKIITKKAVFYGCSGYPDCNFMSFDQVLKDKCPKCGAYLVKHKLKTGDVIKCSNKQCDYIKKEV